MKLITLTHLEENKPNKDSSGFHCSNISDQIVKFFAISPIKYEFTTFEGCKFTKKKKRDRYSINRCYLIANMETYLKKHLINCYFL